MFRVLAILVVLAASPVCAATGVVFDFDCADPKLLDSVELREAAHAAVADLAGGGVREWADRAVVSTGSKGSVTYFVPLTCGATGNCTWAVLSVAPRQDLGRITGAVIRTSTGDGAVLAYERMGAAEGRLVTYKLRDGRYDAASAKDVTTEAAMAALDCLGEAGCCK